MFGWRHRRVLVFGWRDRRILTFLLPVERVVALIQAITLWMNLRSPNGRLTPPRVSYVSAVGYDAGFDSTVGDAHRASQENELERKKRQSFLLCTKPDHRFRQLRPQRGRRDTSICVTGRRSDFSAPEQRLLRMRIEIHRVGNMVVETRVEVSAEKEVRSGVLILCFFCYISGICHRGFGYPATGTGGEAG